METWQTILIAFGGNAALLAVLGVIGKSFLDKLIVRDTKQFESDLKAKSDAAIEQLKNELQLKTIEHQIRFSRLHEKRAEVIAELNGFFVEALWEAESFLSLIEWSGEPTKQQKHIAAMHKLTHLYRYFDKHRIYLPPELCISMEKLVIEVRSLSLILVFMSSTPRTVLAIPLGKKSGKHVRQAGWLSRIKYRSRAKASKTNFALYSELPLLTLHSSN